MQSTDFQTKVIRPVEIYKESWVLIKDQYWLIFAITIVGLILGGAVPIVVIGPAICGIYLCLFRKIEGREVMFEQLFKGFDYFKPSLIVAVVTMVPVFVLIFTIYIPMIGMAIAGPRMSERELVSFFIGAGVFEFFVAFFMVCLHTLLMFAFPLIVDRKLTGIQAMKTSAKAVWQNLGGVAGLFGVGFLVAIVGYLMLCVGIYLVIPLILMSNAVAFRKIFPPVDLPSLDPPPPTAYQGL
jgi:uncharacterized membrane protein